MSLEERVEAFRDRCRVSIHYFLNNSVAPIWIQPKKGVKGSSGAPQIMKLTRGQRRLASIVDWQMQLRGSIRVVTTKCRQVGSTEFWTKVGLWYTWYHHPGGFSILGAHRKEVAEALQRRNRFAWQRYRKEVRPELVNEGRIVRWTVPMEFSWGDEEEEIRSRLAMLTYESPEQWTGEAVSCLILSEFAKTSGENQDLVLKSYMPMFVRGHGCIVVDTTSEDMGTPHHKMVERAARREGDFELVHISMMDDDDCYLDPSLNERVEFGFWARAKAEGNRQAQIEHARKLRIDEREDEILVEHLMPYWHQQLDEEEQQRIHPYGWVLFRRWKRDEEFQGSEELFRNQYPLTWQESFRARGKTVFSLAVISREEERVIKMEPPRQGVILARDGRLASNVDPRVYMARTGGENPASLKLRRGDFRFEERPYGVVNVVSFPQEGEEYIVTSDYSEGVPNGDWSASSVWWRDDDKLRQVAWFRLRVPPEDAADLVAALGCYYNMAWQVPEVNSIGAAALALLRAVYPAGRIFRRTTEESARGMEPSENYGWKMTGRTKMEALGEAVGPFKDGIVVVNSSRMLKEMRTFVVQDGKATPAAMHGKDEDGESYRDDEVVNICVATYAHRHLPWRAMQARRRAVAAEDEYDGECEHWITDSTSQRCAKCGIVVATSPASEENLGRYGTTLESMEARWRLTDKKSSFWRSASPQHARSSRRRSFL